jgi:glycogen debranching enzyme
LEKQYLQKHFDYLENLKEYGTHPPMIRAITCWVKHEHGYFWEGGRSGMDNTPRGRKFAPTKVNRPDNKHILWVDAIAQQALSALYIAKLSRLADERDLESCWLEKYEVLKKKINELYWDEEDGFYYDITAVSGEKVKVMTPASYWVLLAGAAPEERARKMAEKLTDPHKFGGYVPCVTLSRDDPDFNAEHGLYWRGAMWVPTAYMTIKALEQYGMKDLADSLAVQLISHMSRTYQDYDPHTIWECYAPNSCAPSHSCNPSRKVVRKDFCGWSALGPISMMIENVVGINADGVKREVEWRLRRTDRHGVRNLRFGGVTASLVFENGQIEIESSAPFLLRVKGVVHKVPVGRTTLPVGGVERLATDK